MSRPPALTANQKQRLKILEPALRDAVRRADYQQAKAHALDIQQLLRPTGHEARLQQAKNWLFEAAMEAGELRIAKDGFVGVRKMTSDSTRVHLEATALLAICHLREGDIESAAPLIGEVVSNERVIRSDRRRRQFRLRVHQRFVEEALLAGFRSFRNERLESSEVQREAGDLVARSTEDELLAELGRAIPPQVRDWFRQVDEISRRNFPKDQLKYLPPPKNLLDDGRVGQGQLIHRATNEAEDFCRRLEDCQCFGFAHFFLLFIS